MIVNIITLIMPTPVKSNENTRSLRIYSSIYGTLELPYVKNFHYMMVL